MDCINYNEGECGKHLVEVGLTYHVQHKVEWIKYVNNNYNELQDLVKGLSNKYYIFTTINKLRRAAATTY